MQILPSTPTSLNLALSVLAEGGVVAHATETCYGLACDITNATAVARLFQVKQRPVDQPASALFASLDQAKEYAEWNDAAEELASRYLPGPLTIVLPVKGDDRQSIFPNPNPSPNQTLGIRLSSHPLAQELVERFGKPLTTTSANLSGKPNPYSVDEIVEQFQDCQSGPDLILDSGELPKAEPSTVVDCAGGKMQVLREGSLQL